MDAEKTVLVAVRSRPLLMKAEEAYNPGLMFTESDVSIQDKSFSFDYVFPPGSSNSQVYSRAVENRLHRVFEGYNLTIFAYGQTGSGKTYTMGTNYPPVFQNDSGIILLSVSRIFEDIRLRAHEFEFSVNISFLEVYKEDVYDLLTKGKKSAPCQLREDFEGIKVANVTEAPVSSVEEVLAVLEQGCQGRSTAATAMNEHSSRSHSLFILTIEQRNKSNFETKKSKFQLVDLAGSERADQSKTEGLRFKEGIDINRGLLALGKVISALSDGKSHIPYRDSKLTRLLMDSLGGNSYTLMIACISPSISNSDETISTLRYASRARRIRNKPVINNDPPDVQIKKLKQQVELLQTQLYKRPSNLENVSGLEEFSELREQNENLKKELNKCLRRISELTGELIKGEETMGAMKGKMNELYKQIQTCMSKCDVNDPSIAAVGELITLMKEIEVEFQELVSNSQIIEYINKENFSKVKDQEASDASSINSGSDTSDDENPENIGRRLEMVELQLLQKQEIAEHMEVLSQVINDNSSQNLNILQEKIDILLKERKELEIALKNSEKKLHEERNKRYNECQVEIKSLEKELLRSKLLNKVKEENKKKVENLQREIQNLKSMRVKLVKKMKLESDNFRKMQIAKDREVEKLKKNERKKEFEMLKLRNNFQKQVNAFKQKIEKYQSLNKRLNEARSKHGSQLILKDKKIPKQNMEAWLSKEIEIESLKKLTSSEYNSAKENMGHLTEEAHNIQRVSSKEDDKCSSNPLILLSLEAEKLEKQKSIHDHHASGEKDADRWSTISSMIDAKTALTVLFEKCIEDYVKLNSEAGSTVPAKQKELEEKIKECEEERNDLISQNKSLKEKMFKMKKDFENKLEKEKCEQNVRVIQCLKDMNDFEKCCAESQSDTKLLEKIQSQEQVIENLQQRFEDYEKLREEIEFWKAECRNKARAKKGRYLNGFKKSSDIDETKESMMMEFLEEDLEESFQNNDNENKDPDWRLTPLHKQHRKRTFHVLKEQQSNPEVSAEVSAVEESEMPSKRSFSGCGCPGDCRTMRCACRKKMKACEIACSCNHNSCVNFVSEVFFVSDSSITSDSVNFVSEVFFVSDSSITSGSNFIF